MGLCLWGLVILDLGGLYVGVWMSYSKIYGLSMGMWDLDIPLLLRCSA